MELFSVSNAREAISLRQELYKMKLSRKEGITPYFTRISEIRDQLQELGEVMSDTEMTTVVLNALPEEWGNFTSSLYRKKEATPFHDLWSLCKIEETRLKAKVDTRPTEKNHAFSASYRKKGRFEKFGPQNKRRNMDNIRCFGCNQLGHYKRNCPKYGKDKRKKEKSHVTNEREEPDAKKSKKEEAKDLYY